MTYNLLFLQQLSPCRVFVRSVVVVRKLLEIIADCLFNFPVRDFLLRSRTYMSSVRTILIYTDT